jgi:starch synthase (maltosyl-transferring)
MEQHIFIEDVQPAINDGRYAIKRVVGQPWEVEATIFRDGADIIRAVLQLHQTNSGEQIETPMTLNEQGLDRWSGTISAEEMGRYEYCVVAWTDVYATWVREMDRKITAGRMELSSEILEGKAILERALKQADDQQERLIEDTINTLENEDDYLYLLEAIQKAEVLEAMYHAQERRDMVVSEPCLCVWIERPKARFSTWYEFFVRSQTDDPSRSGTFKDAERRLPYLKDLGFDVIYLAPIHPIGFRARKGRNNAVMSSENDPGSPWAIGSPAGGHTAIEPALGTMDDFENFVETAKRYGIEIALDFAIQCSPDHPWVEEHPEWFHHRPDGTIKYAENPPKRYEDIYPVNFDTEAKESLWNALKDVVCFWIDKGIRIFRVDNPHTKPLVFWRWLIREVHEEYPDVVFLSEAFARPAMMQTLAKIGFTQSYTYFTWRNTKWELMSYMTELVHTDSQYYFRPNFFANTPDILPTYLQRGGQPAFRIRQILAGTLSPSYGIYSGFEFCENEPIPGKEEYINSEKYEIKVRDWSSEYNIKNTIRRVNEIRRENPALQQMENLHFLSADNDNILSFVKLSHDGSNVLLITVNLDPANTHACTVRVPLDLIGMPWGSRYEVRDLLTDERYIWSEYNYVQLNPQTQPAHIMRVEGNPH